MLYAAKNGIAAGAEYIRFGTGRRNLILLPGLGDGLRTMKGMAQLEISTTLELWTR